MAQGWLAIVNPVSGENKNEKKSEIIIQHLINSGVKLEVKKTYSKGSAITITKEMVEAGYTKLIVIGGDGTLHEVVNGVMLQQKVKTNEVKIAMFSLGTGNDFIRTLNIPKDYSKATQLLLSEKTKTIDAGRVTFFLNGKKQKRFFINVLGMAFDGAVTERANSTKGAIGKLTYLKSVLVTLFKYEPTKIKIIVDDKVVADETIYCINIGNCKYSGGGMRLVPDAIPDDGYFDITILKPLSNLVAIANLHRLFNGTIKKIRQVTAMRGKSIKVYSQPEICAEAEGEFLGWSSFEVEIVPKAITIIAP